MTLNTIEEEVRRLLGGITTTEYSDADLDNSVNRYYQDFIVEAILASGEWQVQGEIATTNIVASQAEYVFPTDLIQLHRIEADLTGGTKTWEMVDIIDMRTVKRAISNDTTTISSGLGTVRIYDDSIFFSNPPTSNSTAGLKIWYSKEGTALTGTDEPLLVEQSHMGLVYGACVDFTIAKNLVDELRTFKALLEEKKEELRKNYAQRLSAKNIRIKTRTEAYE